MNYFLQLIAPFSILVFLLGGCKQDECVCPPVEDVTKDTVTVYHFEVADLSSGNGFCGNIVEGYTDSLRNHSIQLKVINLPEGMVKPSQPTFTGLFEVLPQAFECRDGRPDPLPGQQPPIIKPRFAQWLSFQPD